MVLLKLTKFGFLMRRDRFKFGLFVIGLLPLVAFPTAVRAHEGSHGSVHDTVAAIIQRMRRDLPADQLIELTAQKVEAFLIPQEREVLGTSHIRFRVNVPVVITVVRDASLGDEPFWLRERGFKATDTKFKVSTREFDTWEKSFASGEIG